MPLRIAFAALALLCSAVAEEQCEVTETGLTSACFGGRSLGGTAVLQPSVVVVPASPVVTVGGTVLLSLIIYDFPGVRHHYLWQVRPDNRTPWAFVAHSGLSMSQNFQPAPATLGMEGRQYRCRVTSLDGKTVIHSQPATLHVAKSKPRVLSIAEPSAPDVPSAPEVPEAHLATEAPEGPEAPYTPAAPFDAPMGRMLASAATLPARATVNLGASATFSVSLSGFSGRRISYTWQVRSPQSTAWNYILDGNGNLVTSSSYTTAPAVAASNGKSYRAIVSQRNSFNAIFSSPATLIVANLIPVTTRSATASATATASSSATRSAISTRTATSSASSTTSSKSSLSSTRTATPTATATTSSKTLLRVPTFTASATATSSSSATSTKTSATSATSTRSSASSATATKSATSTQSSTSSATASGTATSTGKALVPFCKRGYVAKTCIKTLCLDAGLLLGMFYYSYTTVSPFYWMSPPLQSTLFAPMAWCAQNSQQTVPSWIQRPYVYLGYNEPDLTNQCNVSPQAAAAAWSGVLANNPAADSRLISPAMATHGQTPNFTFDWLDAFFASCKSLYGPSGCRIYGIGAHFYGCIPSETMAFLTALWNSYHLPIFFTEFACGSPTDRKTQAQNLAYMNAIVPLLEAAPFVERYYWWADRTTAATCSLTDETVIGGVPQGNSHLNVLGRAYLTLAENTSLCSR